MELAVAGILELDVLRDSGDAVLQIAPPLISDRAQLEDMVERLREVLRDAGDFVGLG